MANSGQVPDIESSFGRAVRMPITAAEQDSGEPEVHEIGSDFSEAGLNCASSTNRCGADMMEARVKLAQRLSAE